LGQRQISIYRPSPCPSPSLFRFAGGGEGTIESAARLDGTHLSRPVHMRVEQDRRLGRRHESAGVADDIETPGPSNRARGCLCPLHSRRPKRDYSSPGNSSSWSARSNSSDVNGLRCPRRTSGGTEAVILLVSLLSDSTTSGNSRRRCTPHFMPRDTTMTQLMSLHLTPPVPAVSSREPWPARRLAQLPRACSRRPRPPYPYGPVMPDQRVPSRARAAESGGVLSL
jgi:hypothetical protein